MVLAPLRHFLPRIFGHERYNPQTRTTRVAAMGDGSGSGKLRLSCIGFCGADDSVDPRLLAAISQVRRLHVPRSPVRCAACAKPSRAHIRISGAVPSPPSARSCAPSRVRGRRWLRHSLSFALTRQTLARATSGIHGLSGACCSATTRRGSRASRPPSGLTTSSLSTGRLPCGCVRARACGVPVGVQAVSRA